MKGCSVYLISLARSKDRRENSVRQINQLFSENEYEIVDAIDGNKLVSVAEGHWSLLPKNEEVQKVENFFSKPIEYILQRDIMAQAGAWLTNSPTAPGCVLSHGLAWSKFLASGDDWALIFEDDFKFEDDITISDLEAVVRLMPCDCPAMVLGYNHWFNRVLLQTSSAISCGSRTIYKPLRPVNITSSVGYFINRLGAEAMLKNLIPVSFAPDWYHRFLDAGWISELYCVQPFLFGLRGCESLIYPGWDKDIERGNIHTSKIRIGISFFAQFCIDKGVWGFGSYFSNRRKRLYGGEPGTYFV